MHRFTGIYNKINKHLFQLLGINLNIGDRLFSVKPDLYAITFKTMLQQFYCQGYNVFWIDFPHL